MGGGMRILLVYPGDITSTIDVADGYEAALTALGHEVATYNYHSAIAFYQESIQNWIVNHNIVFAPQPDAFMVSASEHVVIEAVDFVPDIVLIVSGFKLHRRAYELLNRLCLPLALLLTESPYLDYHQAVILEKGHIAVAFTNDKNSVEPLTDATGVKTVYLPHSFDPTKHRPRPSLLKHSSHYETDVLFHGTLFPDRTALLDPLLDLPYDVAISGIVPSCLEEDIEEFAANIIDNQELAYWYNGTKIAVNHHRTFCGTAEGEQVYVDDRAYSLGPRAFEIAACGAFQLCDDTRPELKEVFGESVGTYSSGENLLEQVEYFMEHGREREEMAGEALARVQNCTFEKRAEQILIPTLLEV